MDLLCPKCGEPWDMDEFHYIPTDDIVQSVLADKKGMGFVRKKDGTLHFKDATYLFKTYGCKVFGWKASCGKQPFEGAGLVSAIYDLEEDDIDGAVADLTDLFSKYWS